MTDPKHTNADAIYTPTPAEHEPEPVSALSYDDLDDGPSDQEIEDANDAWRDYVASRANEGD